MKHDPNDILARIAETAVERILQALGNNSVLAVFLSGSAARGRIAWFDGGERLEIYSDLDISVVVSNNSRWEECRRRARAAAATVSLEGEHFKIFRPPDVGVYTLEDLGRQPARPGTVDVAAAHRLLYGDPAVPATLSKLAGMPMSGQEALYLMENRLLEQADLLKALPDSPSPGTGRFLSYTALKAGQDAGAALLIFANRFSSDPADWPARLRAAADAPETASLFPEGALESIERSLDALRDLAAFLGREEPAGLAEWSRVERLILAVWFNIAARLYPGVPSNWAGLTAARCRRGRTVSNIREFRLLARRSKIGALPAVLMGVLGRRFSPLSAMRLAGLVQSVAGREVAGPEETEMKKMFLPYLDRLTRLLNKPSGDILNRARTLYRELG